MRWYWAAPHFVNTVILLPFDQVFRKLHLGSVAFTQESMPEVLNNILEQVGCVCVCMCVSVCACVCVCVCKCMCM